MAILKAADPMLTELKRIVTTELVMPCSFVHANLFEANYGLDNLSKDKSVVFPVCLHVAVGKSVDKPLETNDLRRIADLYCMLLQRYDAPSADYSSEDVSELVYGMHQLADNLQYRINKSRLSVNGGIPAGGLKITDLYGQFDAHLFGVGVEFSWEFDLGFTGVYLAP